MSHNRVLWLYVKPVDSYKLPSAFCVQHTSTSSEVSEWHRHRTTTKLLVQTYVNKETNSL